MSQYKRAAVLALFVTLLNVAKLSLAQSDQIAMQTQTSAHIDYEPFSGLPGITELTLRLSHSDQTNANNTNASQRRHFRVRIRPTDRGPLQVANENGVLPISFEGDNNGSTQLFNNEYQQDIYVDTPLNDALELNYHVAIPESIYASAGEYNLLLDLDLIDLEANETVGSTQTVELSALVESKIQTNIAGTRANYESGSKFAVVDFGELQSGESDQVFIQVRGNAFAKITVDSDHQGKMVHKDLPNLNVDYSVSVDGEYSDLATPLVLSRPVAQDLQGSAYPMQITVGNVENSYSGIYQDIITVTVSPQ